MPELTEQQRVERARLARQSLEFLEPAFETVKGEYRARLSQVCAATPWEASKISALANAERIANEVQAQLVALVADGTDAQSQIDRAKKIETLSPAKRRLLQIGVY